MQREPGVKYSETMLMSTSMHGQSLGISDMLRRLVRR